MAQATVKSQPKKQTNHWLILILLALAQFMVILDVSIVNVALPSIQKAFGMNQTSLQWIVTAYTIAFGGFLLFGGRAADLFGRRRLFLIGITLFTIASLASGLSQSGGMLIIFRALQGLAGAFMSPAALSIVLVTYNQGHERNVALSVWGAVASGGAAVGVLLGGILTQYLDWRWNFFVNVPIGIAVVVTALRILDRHESNLEHNNLDLPGAVLVTGGLMALVYALVKAPSNGWTSGTSLALFALSAAALVGFVVNELRAKHPLMPLGIFRIRNLSGANSVMLMMAAGMFAVFFFSTLYMQQVLGYTPVKTGLSFLVVPFVLGATAANVPRLIQKIGYRPILIVAPLFVAAGLFYLSHVPVDGTFWRNMAPGLALMGIGMGGTFVSVTIAATDGVPKNESGLASGILNTGQQVGGAVGLAILTGVAAATTKRFLGNLQTRPDHHAVLVATVRGFHDGFLIGSCFALTASLIAILVIRQKRGAETGNGEPAMMG